MVGSLHSLQVYFKHYDFLSLSVLSSSNNGVTSLFTTLPSLYDGWANWSLPLLHFINLTTSINLNHPDPWASCFLFLTVAPSFPVYWITTEYACTFLGTKENMACHCSPLGYLTALIFSSDLLPRLTLLRFQAQSQPDAAPAETIFPYKFTCTYYLNLFAFIRSLERGWEIAICKNQSSQSSAFKLY